MKQIQLTKGQVALVDDADYEWLSQYKWFAKQDGCTLYAIRNITVAKNKQKTERMHRLILGLQPGDGQQCDHRDSNGLNNQRSNLRKCTPSQNQHSQRKHKGGTSKYKGVTWRKDVGKWQSQIVTSKKRIYLGLFDLEHDAAWSYDLAAVKYFGGYALTNKMMELL